MSYSLHDWFLDAVDRGQCLSCKGFTLERCGLVAQCYGCGRWFSGYDIGHAYSDLRDLSTAHQKQKKQRQHGQSYDSEKFEEKMSSGPESPEDYGNYPE